MRKVALTIVAMSLLGASCAMANSIVWGVQSVSSYTWNNHLDQGMEGSVSACSFLIQLIYAGANGVIDDIYMIDADGTGSDDVMVAFSKFGSGTIPRTDGKCEPPSYNNTYANGSKYYMRAWEGVSAGSGATPSGVQWYGNSMTFTVTGYNADPAFETEDNFFATQNLGGSSGTYAMQAVPEPSTMGLLLIGVGMVALRRMRRS
jgi:hypothetical protein